MDTLFFSIFMYFMKDTGIIHDWEVFVIYGYAFGIYKSFLRKV